MSPSRDRFAQDLDGTLYPTRQAAARSWRLILRYARLFRAFRQVRGQVRSIRPISDLHALQADLVAERLRMASADARSLIEDVVYTRLPSALGSVCLHPGVEQTLKMLRQRGVKLGVLSDMPPEAKLRDMGLSGFCCTVTSEETHYLKPNPEPFGYVAEVLGVPPDQMMYVGDNYRYDIRGGNAAGMLTAHCVRKQAPGSWYSTPRSSDVLIY